MSSPLIFERDQAVRARDEAQAALVRAIQMQEELRSALHNAAQELGSVASTLTPGMKAGVAEAKHRAEAAAARAFDAYRQRRPSGAEMENPGAAQGAHVDKAVAQVRWVLSGQWAPRNGEADLPRKVARTVLEIAPGESALYAVDRFETAAVLALMGAGLARERLAEQTAVPNSEAG